MNYKDTEKGKKKLIGRASYLGQRDVNLAQFTRSH